MKSPRRRRRTGGMGGSPDGWDSSLYDTQEGARELRVSNRELVGEAAGDAP